MQAEDANVEELKWIDYVLTYAAEKADTEESLRQDPDLQLVPRLIDKIVIPKLERMYDCDAEVSHVHRWKISSWLGPNQFFCFVCIKELVKIQWDPLSVSQTHSLVATIRNILSYPFIAPKSKLFLQLMDTIISKIDQAIENDVFIPVLPKQYVKSPIKYYNHCLWSNPITIIFSFTSRLFDAGKSNVFFQKQFVYAVKLYGNLVCWKDILNEDLLNEKANVSLLNKYLLMSIRMLSPIEAANKCIMVSQAQCM